MHTHINIKQIQNKGLDNPAIKSEYLQKNKIDSVGAEGGKNVQSLTATIVDNEMIIGIIILNPSPITQYWHSINTIDYNIQARHAFLTTIFSIIQT